MNTTTDYGKPLHQRGNVEEPHMTVVTPAEDVRSIMLNNVSWGAVFAGVVVALVVQLIINMIGIGIGAATIDPIAGTSPGATSFSIGAGLWFVVSGILGALAGGYTAGRLSGKPKESTASWHGLSAWALTTLVVVALVGSSVGSVVGGAFSTMTRAIGTATSSMGQAASTATGANPFSSIEQSIQTAVPGSADPAAVREAAVSSVRALVTGDQAQKEQARERAIQAVANAQNISVAEARTKVGDYEAEYNRTVAKAKETATQVADTAAGVVSTSALLGALALVLGAAAAWFGGRMGVVDPTITARVPV